MQEQRGVRCSATGAWSSSKSRALDRAPRRSRPLQSGGSLVGTWAAMGVATADEFLRLGREALGVADWERARAFFEQAAELGETAEVLDGLGEALQFGGEHVLAILHVSVQGNVAAANGWMARAESLLEGVEESAAHGWLVLDRAPWSSDASERQQLATAAIAIARRYGDRDLEFDAMALLGDAYVAAGRVTEG